jgi:membrane glycosyltransferase
MGMLIVPKLLAYIVMLSHKNEREKFGGGFRAFAGILTETFLSGLTAPVMMIFQSSAVAGILMGRDAGWQVQRRDDGVAPREDTFRRYSVPTLFGIAMAVSAYAVSLALLLWMMPVIIGLLLAIPIAILSTSASASSTSRLFVTPEVTSPLQVMRRADELANAQRQTISCPLLELRSNADLREAHLNNLFGSKPRKRGEVDPHLAIARAKIEDAETFDEAAAFLSPREKFAVLDSPAALRSLLALPPSETAQPTECLVGCGPEGLSTVPTLRPQ